MTDVAEIAAKLTKAQREAVCYDGVWWGRSGLFLSRSKSVTAALFRRGLVQSINSERPTDLGLAVRANLMESGNDAS